jgi:HD-GYP domain-containing protein (c-di-GMP phosphodiesterase class II)
MQTLERLALALEEMIPGTAGHSRRVAAYARELAVGAGLPAEQAARIGQAGTVHDIGKTCVPDAVLNKPGPLSPRERRLIRQHAVAGAAMVAGAGDAELALFVRHHHERFDGGGYPDGLAGETIPLGARVIAVADTFDALTSNRPYRQALGHTQALQVLGSAAGSQLDPELVACFGAGQRLLQAA